MSRAYLQVLACVGRYVDTKTDTVLSNLVEERDDEVTIPSGFIFGKLGKTIHKRFEVCVCLVSHVHEVCQEHILINLQVTKIQGEI